MSLASRLGHRQGQVGFASSSGTGQDTDFAGRNHAVGESIVRVPRVISPQYGGRVYGVFPYGRWVEAAAVSFRRAGCV